LAEVGHDAFVKKHVNNIVPSDVLRQHFGKLVLHFIVTNCNGTLRLVVTFRILKGQYLLNFFKRRQEVVFLYMLLKVVFEVLELLKQSL